MSVMITKVSKVFKSTDQVCWQIIEADLQKRRTVVRSIVFSYDVTAAILVSQNNETAAMLVSQTNPVGV